MSVYLDSAATTRPSAACISAALEAMEHQYGNPSSLHAFGLQAQLCVDAARKQVASALGCAPESLTFTSGATESSHLAIRGAAAVYGKRKRRVITTAVEHASVRAAFDLLEEEGFAVVRIAPRSDGRIAPEDVLAAADDSTCLVSMMLVNNETGAILPVAETFAALKRLHPEIITHCDAVQGFLKIPVTPQALSADLLTVSGHKVHAAKGTGALYHKKGIRLKPLLTGGEQENGLRAGTEAVPLIAGFGAACADLAGTVQKRYETVSALRDTAVRLLGEIGGVTVQSPADASPYILSFSVEGLRSETMLHFLAERGIYVSSGSACSRGRQSGVLQAFHIKQNAADSTLRISFCAENTADDLVQLADALRDAQQRLVHKRR